MGKLIMFQWFQQADQRNTTLVFYIIGHELLLLISAFQIYIAWYDNRVRKFLFDLIKKFQRLALRAEVTHVDLEEGFIIADIGICFRKAGEEPGLNALLPILGPGATFGVDTDSVARNP